MLYHSPGEPYIELHYICDIVSPSVDYRNTLMARLPKDVQEVRSKILHGILTRPRSLPVVLARVGKRYRLIFIRIYQLELIIELVPR